MTDQVLKRVDKCPVMGATHARTPHGRDRRTGPGGRSS